jgi:colicin import membrane protein
MSYRITSSILLSLGLLCASSGNAQESAVSAKADGSETLTSVMERYPSGAIDSVEVADRALEDIKRQRSVVETQFAQNEASCYEKFFVTACMDGAKERRRKAMKQLESIEVEANSYNRRARAEKREQALRDRQAKQAEQPDTQATANANAPAGSGDIADVERRARKASSEPRTTPAKTYNTERAAQHAQELAQEKEKERADTQKRMENIRAYEKKQQRSLERQREIAEEKKGKERVRAAETNQ